MIPWRCKDRSIDGMVLTAEGPKTSRVLAARSTSPERRRQDAAPADTSRLSISQSYDRRRLFSSVDTTMGLAPVASRDHDDLSTGSNGMVDDSQPSEAPRIAPAWFTSVFALLVTGPVPLESRRVAT